MANLNGFNANEVEPAAPFEPLPAGKYLAAITASEMKPTKKGDGSYLQLEFARMMIVDIHKRGRGQTPGSARDLPDAVLDIARWWAEFTPGTRVVGNLYTIHPEPRVVPFTPEAVDALTHLQRMAEDEWDDAHERKDEPSKTAWSRTCENDFVTDEAFDEMLLAWFGNAARVLKPGGSFYIWGGYANIGNYPAPLKKCGLYFSQGIVWDKQHPVLTRKDMMGAFEICFYGWKEGAGHKFYGPNNATDLWHVKKVNSQSMVHLTEKPVELAVRSIQYSSKPGENVLDLFGGSGSTLIGCEQTDRRAFLMELDAPYCEVIVQRWEEFTGRKAERVAARDATIA